MNYSVLDTYVDDVDLKSLEYMTCDVYLVLKKSNHTGFMKLITTLDYSKGDLKLQQYVIIIMITGVKYYN